MRKILKVALFNEERAYTELTLPASPYTALDALEKLRLDEGAPHHWGIVDKLQIERLAKYLDQDGSFFELNALCQRLAVLNEEELAVVEGLARMEHDGNAQPVPLPRLIDMAYSTDCCHLVEEAVNDHTLGRFCAANGFVPEADGLSDQTFELLDFAKIGQEFRQNEGGVFTSGGYVQKHDELRQVYDTLDLTPKTPDYAILVETASGCQIKLPLPLGEAMADEPVQCVDCAAPSLIGLSGTIGTWDMLAHRLTYLTVDGELTKYKAVLDAVRCDELGRALTLADRLDEYTLDPKVCEPEDVAMERLAAGLSSEDMELLLPRLNLYSFGKDLLEHGGGTITGYGLIQPNGGEQEHQPAQGGMEGLQ